MSSNIHLDIKTLYLDLKNFRTVPQKTEQDAIKAMLAIKPERFYAIIESIIEDGYLPTENLIILDDKKYIVKEGNRRTAALKLAHKVYPADDFNLPDSLKEMINAIDATWIVQNSKIPCSVYSLKERPIVDKIVNLTHAKGEKASRDPWTSVAKARQNRDEKKASEPGLDLLEKYIANGQNLTNQQKERWSGDYPLSVLDEAIRVLSKRLGFDTTSDLATAYPKIKLRDELEALILNIGLKSFGFTEMRDKVKDFALPYGIPLLQSPSNQPSQDITVQSNPVNATITGNNNAASNSTIPANQANNANTTITPQPQASSSKTKAYPIHDQRTVTQTLKKFNPKGADRQKLVTLRDELKKLKVKDNPIAFCFLLRSMFEISATIYCNENSIPLAETKGNITKQKTLQKLLSAVTNHLTSNSSNMGMTKALHGANSELSKSTGLLSVTSMNQLVHNTSFSIAPHDIFTLFNNVYPLLEAMN